MYISLLQGFFLLQNLFLLVKFWLVKNPIKCSVLCAGGASGRSLELCDIPIDLKFFDYVFHGSSSHTNTGTVFCLYKIRSACIFWHRMAWLLVSTAFRAWKTKSRHFIVHHYSNVMIFFPPSLCLSYHLFISLPSSYFAFSWCTVSVQFSGAFLLLQSL